MSKHSPQRSALYVPAINQRALAKAESIDADWVIFDLEDSVAVESKAAARESLRLIFKERNFGRSHCAIRCNAIGDYFGRWTQ